MIVGIVARHFRGRGQLEVELKAAKEEGRAEGRQEGEEEARWENLERATAAIQGIVSNLEGFVERLTTANETSADALVKVNSTLEQMQQSMAETHKLTLALTKRRKQDRRRQERRR